MDEDQELYIRRYTEYLIIHIIDKIKDLEKENFLNQNLSITNQLLIDGYYFLRKKLNYIDPDILNIYLIETSKENENFLRTKLKRIHENIGKFELIEIEKNPIRFYFYINAESNDNS